jgi:hypothetical protein
VAVVYNPEAIYFGVWCFQHKETKLIAKSLDRDFDYSTDDDFQIALSPFNDHRNGYLFVINPNGARADALISNFETGNADWNGVWDVRTTITSEGWFC